jgi:hypothetical protein
MDFLISSIVSVSGRYAINQKFTNMLNQKSFKKVRIFGLRGDGGVAYTNELAVIVKRINS